MKRLLLTLFIVASLILPIQGNADITKFGGFLPCTSDNGTLCTTSRYISTPGVTFSTSATFSFLTSGYLPKAGTSGALGNSVIYQDSSANIGLGTATFGTSAAKVVGIPSGTAPTTSPADAAQVWVADHNGQAGYARLHQRPESVTYTPASPVALLSELEMYKNPLAFAQGVAMTAAASGSSGITVADNDNIDFGTGNFTLVWKGSLPDWTPSASQMLMWKVAATLRMFAFTDGTIDLYMNNVSYFSTVATGCVDGTVHEIVEVVTRETALADGNIKHYLDGVQLGTTVTIPAGAPGSVTNTTALQILGTDAIRYAGTTHHAYTFNRALTAEEVLSLYKHGIDYADKWGSQTSIITGNDSTFAGASNWANVDIAAFDSTGDLTITANAAGQYCTLPVANATTVAGKKYRLKLDVANLVSTWTIKDFTGTQTIGTISADGTGQSIEFTASTTGGIRIVSVANNSSADIDNVYLYPIGATLALESEGIQRDAWKDSSTNGLNASYPASGYSFLRPIRTDSAEGLLSVTNVSLAADADTTIYTVPTGKRLVLTKAILVVGADAGTSVISIGADGAETDWLPNNTLSALDAANDAAILQPVPNTTPVLVKSYAGGTVIQAKVSSHAGGATNSLSLFGYLY